MNKMLNPDNAWFVWGVSAKQKFTESGSSFEQLTFYGITAINSLFLNGKKSVDDDGFNRHNIDVRHFRMTEGEIDIYLDCDQGILRLCLVGQTERNSIAEITGLNESGNNVGWVPHFVLYNSSIKIRIAKIPQAWFGKTKSIAW